MPVRFGIQIEPQFGFNYKSVEKTALDCEKAGYDCIWVSDHFFLDDKSEYRNCMEAWILEKPTISIVVNPDLIDFIVIKNLLGEIIPS